MGFSGFALCFFTIALLSSPVFSDLVLSKVDRRICLTSQIVRTTATLKVENEGSELVSEVLLAYPEFQAKNLAYLTVSASEGKGKQKVSTDDLPVEVVLPENVPPALSFYSVTLPKGLAPGDSLTLDVMAVFTHALQPFPEKIAQADIQLVMFQDSAYYLSPYAVKVQSLSVKLLDARIESCKKLENTELHGSEIKYGPYENVPAFSYSPGVIHFKNNQPFSIAQEVEREIEISHWGNVQITEYYKLIHGGARSKGEFSRHDFQARPNVRGASAVWYLVATLPPRAHSVYCRDENGDISTTHLRSESKKMELLFEPKYPMFGGWRTAFTFGYGLPLQDFLFQSEGKRFLNISFSSPMVELVIDKLIVKVVLPEGSKDISVSTPFPVKHWQETKISHLDIDGRPVVVLEKTNVVPEHNKYFQVYYKFNKLSMLREPLMLISGFFLLFIACIIYTRANISIFKSSASYLPKQQWEEVQAVIQQILNIINQCLATHNELEASLADLYRTGDVQACKAARKAAGGQLKDLSKELKCLWGSLRSSSSDSQTLTELVMLVKKLVAKEEELQGSIMTKHSTVVNGYAGNSARNDIERRVAPQQQKITASKWEVHDLLGGIDKIMLLV